MYFYIFVSSIAMTYFIFNGIMRSLDFNRPILISIEGVQTVSGERYDITHSRLGSDDYEFYETRYKIGRDAYCIISDHIPDMDVVNTQRASTSISKAEVVIGDDFVDVTEKLIQVAGPQCNFHECPIDLCWLFPNCSGTLHIVFNHTTCEIDIKTSTLIDGASDIPLLNYLTDSEEDVCVID